MKYRIKYKVGNSTMRTGLMSKANAEKMLDYIINVEKYSDAVMYIDDNY